MAAMRLVGWSVGVSAVGTAVQLLWRRWRRFRSRKKFDGLDGIVSFSSRLIAAARAIESMRADALFVDPFARLLAGPKAMARHQAFDEADKSVNINKPAAAAAVQQPQQQQQDGTQQEQQQQGNIIQQQQQRVEMHEGRQVSRLVIRTVFFDEATLMATGQPAPRSRKALAALATHIQQHQLKPCRQVVMLGAGMDTRPWRLPLDPHLEWFELDRSDVLAAKQKALQEAGAGFEPGTSAQTAAGTKQNSSSSGTNSNSKNSSSSVQVPLRVGQWACASADLQKAGWVQKLQEVGLQPDQPTVWAAEGLLYYLEPSSVGPMLKEAAGSSPPGSIIITNFMTDEGLKLLRTSPLKAQPADASTAADGTATNSNSQPADGSSSNSKDSAQTPAAAGTAAQSDHAPATSGSNDNGSPSSSSAGAAAAQLASSDAADGSSKQDDSNTTGSSSGAGASTSSTAGAQQPGGANIRKTGLMSEFKWGCPDNVEEFFAECGWQLLVRYSLTQCTDAYGWNVLHTAASRKRTDSQEVQYVVGVVMK